MKPFSIMTFCLLLIVTILHLFRLYHGWAVQVGSIMIPMWVSTAAVVVLLILMMGLWKELRK